MTDRYAVMGNPIAHSKSPQIHAAFSVQTGQDIEYTRILVEPGELAAAVTQFRQEGGKGLNITVPFKNDAYALADRHSERAIRAGAVNTLLLNDDGTIDADNTDGVGLVRDLTQNHGIKLQGKRLLILGAGGAVQGVLQPLIEQLPSSIYIANRTADRAVKLAQIFSDTGCDISGGGFDALAGQQFDGIINGTAASLQGELPPLPDNVLAEGGWVYDMMYGAQPTPFMAWANAHGADKVLDGLGMLVEQAAESFTLWRGVRPSTSEVIELLRRDLEATG
ncbi:MAG: shikimate dehydrogenase [Granulosicoccaceae bacterium]|jgi:shikimate dehydrogenase